MKICGPAVHGQLGDLVGNTVFCRAVKEVWPDCELIFAIGNKYKYSSFLFEINKYIDKIHVWDSYDNWPSQKDLDYIKDSGFDIVFNPRLPHSRRDWYNYFHYCQEWTMMHNFPTASSLEPYLNPWYLDEKEINSAKIITISAFPHTDKSFDKSLSIEAWGEICKNIRKLGYIPVELGGKFSQKIENCENPDLSFVDACKLLLQSKLHLSVDCGFGWVAAGYQKNALGFYTNTYDDMITPWALMPKNRNASYLVYKNIKKDSNIDEIMDIIEGKLK